MTAGMPGSVGHVEKPRPCRDIDVESMETGPFKEMLIDEQTFGGLPGQDLGVQQELFNYQ